MKRRILSCFVILLINAVLPACKRAETQPVDIVTSDLIWDVTDKNAVYAQQFLNNIYAYLPTGFNRVGGDYLDDASGDAVPSRNNTTVAYYTNGIVSTINNPDPYFANSYTGIREANIFLSNIDKVPATAQSIITWKAEARFIRAFMYFELLKRYGGIPLIGDQVFTLTDNLQLPRNTYSDCVNYIVSECDAIKGNLTPEPLAATSLGHIPRGAAVALKCRVYLYAASPLFNGGGIEPDATLKALTGYPTADATRWSNVIAAAEELKGYNYYSLISSTATNPTAAQFTTNFMSIFTVKSNTEVILAKQSANDFSVESNNAPVGYTGTVASQGRTSPVQEFVNAFPMNSGLDITNPASNYSPSAPYTNRDPRLAATIFYNGMTWLNRPIQTFEGGLDKPNTTAVQTKTGYYLKKFMADAFTTGTAYSVQSHNFILFRYAEIILNYAEALNEVGTRTEDAVAQIILLRKRAGIAAGINGRYGIPPVGISQSDMRTLIQNERRIELSFEEHRFWDLRRWKTASVALSGTVSGMQITVGAGGVLTYQVVPVGTMIWSDKLYHMPLPYDEITKNQRLLQNYGW